MRVGVAVFFDNAAKVTDAAGTFEAQITVRLRWRDPGLAFDAHERGTNRLEFTREAAVSRLRTMWSPMLTFANTTERTPTIEQGLLIYADGSVVQVQRLRTTFESRFELSAFPFDRQGLTVRLLSERYNDAEVLLVQEQTDMDQSGFRDEMHITGWEPTDVDFSSDIIRRWNGDGLSQIEAHLLVHRDPTSHLFFIFTPLLLILLVPSLMVLYAQADTPPRMALWSSASLALVALSFTMGVRYPALTVSSLVGQVLTIGFGYEMLMVALTMTVYSAKFVEKSRHRHLLEEAGSVLRWVLPVGLVSLVVIRTLLTSFN